MASANAAATAASDKPLATRHACTTPRRAAAEASPAATRYSAGTARHAQETYEEKLVVLMSKTVGLRQAAHCGTGPVK